jgi:hypothetical protein
VPFGPWVDDQPGVPAATVAPGDIDVTVAEGATATDLFGITNTGEAGSTLEFTVDVAPASCAAPQPVAWLDAQPAEGSVAQGATAKVTATIDATDLADGSYAAKICVRSNDPAHAVIEVPVSATVVVNPAEIVFIDGFEQPAN